MTHSVPIVMYHRVTPEHPDSYAPYDSQFSTIAVSPEAFESQMAWLARDGYQTLTLDDLLDARDHGRSIPHRSVVLTFDDGYQDFADYAAPVLRKHGFTAHLFLVAGRVGQSADWDYDEFGWNFPLFSWDTARELDSQGFHCDAHGLTHRKLAELTADECTREVYESRRMLSDQLDREIRHFSYPHGSYNEETQAIVQEAGFESACAVWEGLSPVDDDRYALHRVWVHADDSLSDFRWAVRRGVPPKRWPRAIARKVRDSLKRVLSMR